MKTSRTLRRTLWFSGVLLALTPLTDAGIRQTLGLGFRGSAIEGPRATPPVGRSNHGIASAQTVGRLGSFCDDFNDAPISTNGVTLRDGRNANVTTSSNCSSGAYDHDSASSGASPTRSRELYEQGIWLGSQMASNSSDNSSLQYALWDKLAPGARETSFGGNNGIQVSQSLTWAASDSNANHPASFSLATNIVPVKQDATVRTPEPATVVLLLVGIGAMFLLVWKREWRAAIV